MKLNISADVMRDSHDRQWIRLAKRRIDGSWRRVDESVSCDNCGKFANLWAHIEVSGNTRKYTLYCRDCKEFEHFSEIM